MAMLLKEKINNLVKKKGINIEELKELLITLSDPWEDVRGILKHKKIDALKYQKKIRREWGRKA